MKKIMLFMALFLAQMLSVHGQNFSSGSTGADGALDLSSGSQHVQLPESGVLNYTTVNIPVGTTLTFKRNSRNTPVTLLVQGNVTIGGTISVNAGSDPDKPTSRKTPGPGGFYGGTPCPHRSGLGPGGGQPEQDGRWVGSLSLVPIIGGSGGGGYTCGFPSFCCEGGGGGGAIVIASSASILALSGSMISANSNVASGAQGSGGAIRLVASSLDIRGSLQACTSGGCGVIRLEAPLGSLVFTGSSNPPAGLFPINSSIVPNASPLLTILSIGGFPVPSYAGQRFDTYDILLPTQLTDPIPVVVHAKNIPVGTEITVGLLGGSPNGISTPGTLSGTFESSTATATISNLNRTTVTYLLATATFDVPTSAKNFNPTGRDHVARVRLETGIGIKPKLVFLRSDGTVIDETKLPRKFLEQLGL